MALLFSFSLAMDKFVIGRVVTAIDYPSIQFSIRLAVTTTLTTRLSSFSNDGPSWQHSINTRMHRSMRGRNWTFVSVRRLQHQRGLVATNLSNEEATKRSLRRVIPRYRSTPSSNRFVPSLQA